MTLSTEYYSIYTGILIFIGIWILFRGYKKGCLLQIFDLIYSIGSIYFAFSKVEWFVMEYPIYSTINPLTELLNSLIWFMILYMGLKIIYYIIEHFLKKISKLKMIGFVDRLLGLLLSIFKVLLIYTIVVIICLLPIVENGNKFVNSTPLYYWKEFIIDHRGVIGIDF